MGGEFRPYGDYGASTSETRDIGMDESVPDVDEESAPFVGGVEIDNEHPRETLAAITHGTPAEWYESIRHCILEGQAELAMGLTKLAVIDGIDPFTIIRNAVIEGMSTVGRDFKNGEFYVPDVLMASRASHAVLLTLKKYIHLDGFGHEKGTIVVGTVAGDLHDIGKNITSTMLSCEGFEVIDLGIDVVPEVFVEAVRKHHPMLLGISALLTTTVGEMGKIISAINAAGLRDETKVYVSGVPVSLELAEIFGADRYCKDVRDSIDYANELYASRSS